MNSLAFTTAFAMAVPALAQVDGAGLQSKSTPSSFKNQALLWKTAMRSRFRRPKRDTRRSDQQALTGRSDLSDTR